MKYDLKEIRKVFFEDPRWKQVEELLLEFINPLIEMDSVDVTQPAEHVKAEIIGRKLAHEKLTSFLEQAGMIHSQDKEIKSINYR